MINSTNAVQKLTAIIRLKVSLVRGGNSRDIPAEEIIPGDIILLAAGDIVPAELAKRVFYRLVRMP